MWSAALDWPRWTDTLFSTKAPGGVGEWTVPVIVTVGAVATGKRRSPSSQTTVRALAVHRPGCALAVTPSRSTVVVNVTRTALAVPVPPPDRVIMWVTRRPGPAPNGVDVNVGTTSTGV